MKTMKLLLIFLLIILPASCYREKPSSENAIPVKDDPRTMWAESVSPDMELLGRLNVNVDTDLLIDVWRFQSEFGYGFDSFVEYVNRLGLDQIPMETCVEFANSIIDGKWKDSFEKSILQKTYDNELIRTIVKLSNKIRVDNPDLSKKLVNDVFNETDLKEEVLYRAWGEINAASIFHSAGIDGMKKRIESDLNLLLKLSEEDRTHVSDVILWIIPEVAAVDFDQALRLKAEFVEDPLIEIEARAAIGAGLMKADYERGKEYFFKAIDDFNPKTVDKVNKKTSPYSAFELGYNNLKDEDRRKIFDKITGIFESYNRLYLLPPSMPGATVIYEPGLPGWYRDALFNWMKERYEPKERVEKLIDALSQHARRFPRSKHTEEFIGWIFEWIREIKDPNDRYKLLGRISIIPNIVIPERVAKSRPQIMKLAEGFDKNIDKMKKINDIMPGIIFLKDPVKIVKHLEVEPNISQNKDLILEMWGFVRARHYFYPENEGGVASLMDSILNEWKGDDVIKPFEKKAMLAELWSGWNDDKAWKYIQELKKNEGEYPGYLVNTINVTHIYAPGFAKRCLDELVESYKNGIFKKTNPQMEKGLAYELSGSSIQWSEEFAQAVIDKRGNMQPVFAFYLLNHEIIAGAINNGSDPRDIDKLAQKVQEKLKLDLEKYKNSEGILRS